MTAKYTRLCELLSNYFKSIHGNVLDWDMDEKEVNVKFDKVVLQEPLYIDLSNGEWDSNNRFKPIIVVANPNGGPMTFRDFLRFLGNRYNNEMFSREDIFLKTNSSLSEGYLVLDYFKDFVYLEGVKMEKYGHLDVNDFFLGQLIFRKTI